MTNKEEKAHENLLRVCRNIKDRFERGYGPTFEQRDQFIAAVEAFDLELLCGHKVIDECECGK